MCSGSGTLPGLSLSSDLDRPISPRDAACPVTARLGHRAASTPRGNRASPPPPHPVHGHRLDRPPLPLPQ